MDETAFAALMAQVIPVVLLALVVEARTAHELAMRLVSPELQRTVADQAAGEAGTRVKLGSTLWEARFGFGASMVFQAAFLGVLVVYEVGALAVVSGVAEPGSQVRAIVTNPGLVFLLVGVGLLLTVVLNVSMLTSAYHRAGVISLRRRVLIDVATGIPFVVLGILTVGLAIAAFEIRPLAF